MGKGNVGAIVGVASALLTGFPACGLGATEPELLWKTTTAGVGNPSNGALIAVDGSGHVYLAAGTGYSGSVYRVIKFGTNGQRIWEVFHDSPGGYEDPTHLAVDDHGNVYVTGYTTPTWDPLDRDFATIKLDSSGRELWVARHTSGVSDDLPVTVAVDQQGNVYVTGSEGMNGFPEIVTIKYDANGDELWKRHYLRGYRSQASGLAVDDDGRIAVIGSSAGGSHDWTVLGYNPDGGLTWAPDVGSFTENYTTDLEFDGSNNLYVAGGWGGVGAVTLRKYVRGEPTARWQFSHQVSGGTGSQDARVGLDAAGNAYFHVTRYEEEDSVSEVVKLDSQGGRLWLAHVPGGGKHFAVARDGVSYLSAVQFDEANRSYHAIVCLDVNGHQQWSAPISEPGLWARIAGITLGGDGAVFVTGVDSYNHVTAAYRARPAPGKPVLEAPPSDQTALAGGNASFSVHAVGAGGLTYQWRHFGRELPGETNAVLHLRRVLPDRDGGYYSVAVGNAFGVVISRGAGLTIAFPEAPQIMAAERQGSEAFQIIVSGQPGYDHTLEWSTNLVDWTPLTTVRNSSGVVEFTDPLAVSKPCCFYRVVQ